MTQLSPFARSIGLTRSRWIPWIFVAAMLGVVCVNAALIFFAFHSWAGVVTKRPYERGLAYNQLIAAAAQDTALGWSANVAYQSTDDNDEGALTVDLRDANGKPLNGAELLVELVRPLETSPPVMVALLATDFGRYGAPMEHRLRRGQWEARLRVTYGGTVAHFHQRIIVR